MTPSSPRNAKRKFSWDEKDRGSKIGDRGNWVSRFAQAVVAVGLGRRFIDETDRAVGGGRGDGGERGPIREIDGSLDLISAPWNALEIQSDTAT